MPAPRRRGRPTDPDLNAAISRAIHEILATDGWAGLTIDRVAARAGASRATVYRKHGSRHGLLLAEMGGIYEQVPVADTGGLRGDLIALMQDVATVWRDPAHVRFLAALVAAQADDQALREAYAEQFAQRRAATTAIVQRAVERGELADVARGDLLLDFLAGIVAQVVLLRRQPLDPQFAVRVVDALLDGFGR